ncbi:MAG: hypothetical protein QM765_26950 [Myxococcales bacterium]
MTDPSGRTLAAALACCAALAAASGPALAQSEACLGQGQRKVLLDEALLVLTEPLGVENQLAVYDCTPLVREPGVLYKLTSIELGLSSYLAPAYANLGAFLRVTPLSFLRLKAEAMAVGYWPFPLDAAGYFPVSGDSARFSGKDLPASRAGSAGGIEASLEATLRLELALADWAGVALQDVFATEYWHLGGAPFYFNMRRDVVLASSDVLVKNTGVLLAYFKLTPSATLRVGPIDDVTVVPRSGYRAHSLGAVALLELKRVLWGGNLTPFVRLDGYLEHRFRSGVNLFFGLSGSFELGAFGSPHS